MARQLLNFESMPNSSIDKRPGAPCHSRSCAGITLTELVVSIAVTSLTIVGMVSGYLLSVQRAEWSARSAAAQALATERIEQTRAAKWDTLATPAVDEVHSTNFPTEVVTLPLPSSGSSVLATNVTTITIVSEDPPVKMVRVDCIWGFLSRGPFTNTLVTYRSPDQ